MIKKWYKIYYYDITDYVIRPRPTFCTLEAPMPVYPISETPKYLIFEGTSKSKYKALKKSNNFAYFPTLKQAIKAKKIDLISKIKQLNQSVINTRLLLYLFNRTYK